MEHDQTEPKRMLIVDDDEAIISSLASLLESDAVMVRTASSWEQAIELLQSEMFDLVITDLRLKGATDVEGLELISHIKRQRPQTRVVLLTGYGSPEIERLARERGADAYLEKTLPVSLLLERVRTLGFSTNPAGSQREASA